MLRSVLHYDILEKLGEGGMGSVFLATDTKLRREVALKFLPDQISSDASKRKRFQIEARAAAALNHPNIAQVHAIEASGDDSLFIVMEYVEGKELKELITEDSLNQNEKVEIALQIAEALSTAHEKGILHRDIKSNNILVNNSGKVKILDFGLARIQGSEHITKTGAAIGTTAYMSPEQVQGQEIDERSDIWSYGVVLYELFSGELPFQDFYEPAILYKIVNEEPKSVSEHNQNIPKYIEQIINKCLQKDKEDRYRAMNSIIADLKTRQAKAGSLKDIGWNLSRFKPAYLLIVIPILLVATAWLFPFSKGVMPGSSIPAEPKLAVLPINNIGGDSTYQVISEGLVETLSGKLSQIERLGNTFSVIPSSELRTRNIKSAGEAKEIYGVNLAVEASLQQLADHFRLIINLIDADEIRQLDSEIIDVPSHNLVSLQNKGVIALLKMLKIESSSEIDMAIRELDPTQPEAMQYYLMGKAYLQRPSTGENINTAIRLFNRAIEEDSSYALAYAALGESYWRRYDELQGTDDVTTAQKYLEKARELNSNLAAVSITKGIIHRGIGEYEQAITSFEEALEIDPENAAAYRELARTYEEEGLNEQAEETYREAISLDPESWLGYNQLGTFFRRQGRYEDALTQFQHVIDLAPDNYVGYSNKGGVYLSLGEANNAEEMFEHSLALDTTYAPASNLGIIKQYNEDYPDAIKWYEVALNLNPNDYLLWGNLASACEASGQNKEAQQYYRKAIEYGELQLKVNPNDAKLISDLGSFSLDIGDTAKTVQYSERALQLNPENIDIQYRSATIYERIGDRDKALHWVEKALENGYPLARIQHSTYLKKLTESDEFKEIIK